jgi:probable HAF family extracellular repeat protein
MKRYTLAAVTALLVLVPTWHEAIRATAPLYTVEDLGNFGGLVPTLAGINASGQVVGNVSNAFGSQAVRFTDGSGWQALPGLDTAFSVATGINASGDVVGYHVTATGDLRAFRYRDGSGVEDVAPLAGGSITLAFAIDAAGTVVGYGDTPQGMQAFRADPGLPPAALPSFNGGFSIACGMNAAGQIAGYSVTPDGSQQRHADQPRVVERARVSVARRTHGVRLALARSIADGRVGGAAQHDGALHAFLYSDGAGGVDVDTFGSSGSNVEAMAAGLAVGWYTLPDSTTHAFAHNDSDGSFDLKHADFRRGLGAVDFARRQRQRRGRWRRSPQRLARGVPLDACRRRHDGPGHLQPDGVAVGRGAAERTAGRRDDRRQRH